MWINADLFKRIVPQLANLPAASTAERDGANVMRVVTSAACLPAANKNLLLNEGWTHSILSTITGHCVVRYFRAPGGSPIQRLNAPNAYFKLKCYNESFFFFFLVKLQCWALLCRCLYQYYVLLAIQSWRATAAIVWNELFKTSSS